MGVGHCSSLQNLLKMSDVVSLHVAATPDTHHLVDATFCNAMREGAILVNTTRGSVIDESALADAVRSKGIKVGLDVYAAEPRGSETNFTSELLGLPGVYGTHHVGASTSQAQDAVAQEGRPHRRDMDGHGRCAKLRESRPVHARCVPVECPASQSTGRPCTRLHGPSILRGQY